MKHLLVSLLVSFLGMTANAQTTPLIPETATNAGSWRDGTVFLWKCPEQGPVVAVPFTIFTPDGVPLAGTLTCGIPDNTEIPAHLKKPDFKKNT